MGPGRADRRMCTATFEGLPIGFTTTILQSTTLRQLVSAGVPDDADEYFRIAETTAAMCLEKLCEGIRAIYEAEWLRAPNAEELTRILAHNSMRGFPGMIGSLDCMHWAWEKCPVAYHGAYQGKEKVPTIVLEAVA